MTETTCSFVVSEVQLGLQLRVKDSTGNTFEYAALTRSSCGNSAGLICASCAYPAPEHKRLTRSIIQLRYANVDQPACAP